MYATKHTGSRQHHVHIVIITFWYALTKGAWLASLTAVPRISLSSTILGEQRNATMRPAVNGRQKVFEDDLFYEGHWRDTKANAARWPRKALRPEWRTSTAGREIEALSRSPAILVATSLLSCLFLYHFIISSSCVFLLFALFWSGNPLRVIFGNSRLWILKVSWQLCSIHNNKRERGIKTNLGELKPNPQEDGDRPIHTTDTKPASMSPSSSDFHEGWSAALRMVR